jgi:hypothetical protein
MRKVRWSWIVLAGFLGECVAILFLIGLRRLHGYPASSPAPLSPLGSAAFQFELFAVMALFGWWVARKATALPVLNGTLVGVAAVLIYEILAFGQPVPRDSFYFLAHGLKICGGAAGGWLAGGRGRMAFSGSGLCLALACCCTTTALAQKNGPDPIIGTWKLNLSKSQLPQLPGLPKEQTETYREASPGRIELALSRLSGDGVPANVTLVWPSTGGVVEYQQGSGPKGELLIETLVAPGEWLVTYMQDGRQYGTLRKVVSADGKTMRETFKGTVQGQSLEIAVVVDRQ